VQIQVVLYQSSRWMRKLETGLARVDSINNPFTVALWDNDPGTSLTADAGAGGLPDGWRYVASEQGNPGFGQAHNELAQLAAPECEYLLLLNPDALPFFDCLDQLVAVADANPDAALIEAAQFPFEHPKAYDQATLETYWCSAACLLVRRAAFDGLQGFDPALHLYCEDVDLSWRAWLAGWRNLYVPDARCIHVTHRYDLGKSRALEISKGAVGGLYLRRKYFGAKQVERYFQSLRSALSPRLVAAIATEFEALPTLTVDRRNDPHITLEPEGFYAPRRW